jgi:hypothetical protein
MHFIKVGFWQLGLIILVILVIMVLARMFNSNR